MGKIFWEMPLSAVYAYEHCYYALEGVHCKYPSWSPVAGDMDDLLETLMEKED